MSELIRQSIEEFKQKYNAIATRITANVGVITAEALVKRGAGDFATQLDPLFERDDTLVLVIVDDPVRAAKENYAVNQKVTVEGVANGAMLDSTEAEEWFDGITQRHFTSPVMPTVYRLHGLPVPEWMFLPRAYVKRFGKTCDYPAITGRVVAIVDQRVHFYVRVDGKWSDGAELEAMRVARERAEEAEAEEWRERDRLRAEEKAATRAANFQRAVAHPAFLFLVAEALSTMGVLTADGTIDPDALANARALMKPKEA